MAGLTLEVLDRASRAHKAYLTIVGQEPVIGGHINQGGAAITITMPSWPVGIIDYFDYVKITDPHSAVLGTWRYFDWTGDEAHGVDNTIQLWPLAEQANQSFTGNYSDYDSASSLAPPILGSGVFDRPARAAVPATRDLTIGTVNNDGASYQLTSIGAPYGASTVRSTLDDAVSCGGINWWWYIGHDGVVDVMGTPHASVTLDIPSAGHPSGQIIHRKRHDTVSQLYNEQPGTGTYSYDPITGTPIVYSAVASSGAYVSANIGRRVAPTVNFPGARTTAQMNTMATRELARDLKPGETWTIILKPGAGRRRPGEKVTMVDYRPLSGVFTHDPMWVTSVMEHDIGMLGNLGYTSGWQEVVLNAA